MSKLKSLDELKKHIADYETKQGSANKNAEVKIFVGMATCGLAAGSKEVYDALETEMKNQDLKNTMLVQAGCMGSCYAEPTVEVSVVGKESVIYGNVTPEMAKEIITKEIVEGKDSDKVTRGKKSDFINKQVRVALRNCGTINPENIYDYLAVEGYQALGKVLTEYDPKHTIDILKKSGLRGRGGGGFPTGVKWEATSRYDADQKYIICNADEGDPGAFMDRSILEGDPHCVLEAMAIGGYATGATKGIIYIRAEYPLAVSRLEIAIAQAKKLGLLGENIFESGFSFDLEIRYGAGAFVCGEETSLIKSVEGERGEPFNKPPFPSERGLWDKPTTVNNVETFANITAIYLKGADWFASIGTEKSKGTKVFALAGKVNNVGLVEVPMGTSLREIIFEIGGGIVDGKEFKAVQTGGPSGGCIPAQNLDTPIDYDSLMQIGSMMGSGGMIVMDEDDCMVSVAKFYLEFSMEESCGKCTSCRIGNKRLFESLSKITKGIATMKDIEELKELGAIIKDTALCGLGQTSPNPVLSTMTYFWDEYEAHVKEKRCPAGVCKSLVKYEIIEDKCIGCTACARVCPVNCITGEVKKPHIINQEACIKCGACFNKCKFSAIKKV